MMRRRSDLPPTDPPSWSSLVPADSFYARLAQCRDVLLDDEDYVPLYKDSQKEGCPAWATRAMLGRKCE